MIKNNKLFHESPWMGYSTIGSIIFYLVLIYLFRQTTTMGIDTHYIVAFYLVVLMVLLYFYRDPNHVPPPLDHFDHVVVAPSYGKVSKVHFDPERNVIQLCIFLSPFDVHQQYYPINGHVVQRTYDRNGRFELAFNMDKSRYNEKKIHTIQNRQGTFIVTQIAGFLVRSIASHEEVNVPVKCGQRFGMIKFGSRVDLEIPNANRFKLLIKEGDYLHGGNQVIGSFRGELDASHR